MVQWNREECHQCLLKAAVNKRKSIVINNFKIRIIKQKKTNKMKMCTLQSTFIIMSIYLQ